MCYVLDALLSPYVLLSTSDSDTVGESVSDSVGAGCIVMSVFLHYFFLVQLTAVLVQVTRGFTFLFTAYK